MENDGLVSLVWVVYNTTAHRYFTSVLKINPDIGEVPVSFAMKHHEESKYKHLYSHLTFVLLFPPPKFVTLETKPNPNMQNKQSQNTFVFQA